MEKKNPISIVLGSLKNYLPLIFLYSSGIGLLTLATPISVQSLVNTFSFGPRFQPLFILGLLLFAFLLLLTLIKIFQYILIENLQQKIYAQLTAKISRVFMLHADLKTENTANSPKEGSSISDSRLKAAAELTPLEISNRYFDIVIVQKKASYLLSEFSTILLQMTLGLILISIYHPLFIVLGLFILFLALAPIYFLGSKSSQTAVEESTAKYATADWINRLAKVDPSKTSTEQLIKESDQYSFNYLDQRRKHFKSLLSYQIVYLLSFALLNALLLMLGGRLVITNQLSIGQLIAAELVVNSILYNFLYAHKILESYFDLYAACNKLMTFYRLEDQLQKLPKAQEKSPLLSEKSLNRNFYKRFKSIRTVAGPVQNKKTYIKFLGALILASGFLALTPWQQTSNGYGSVTAFNPNNRSQYISSPISGRIEKWYVTDGDFVKKGDLIAKVLDNDPDYFARLESQRDAALKKFEAAKEASNTARLNYRRQRKLVDEGLSSRKDFEKANIRYKKLIAEEASASESLTKAETTLARQKLQEIRAPQDGQILSILKGSGTVNVKVGENLAQFVPELKDNDMLVEIFLQGNDLPLVFPGRKVRLQFEGWPAIQFTGWPSVAVGSFGGVVVATDPLVSKNGLFRALIKPDPEEEISWPDAGYLRQGTRVSAIVLLDEVKVGFEIWRQVNGFPKSSATPPPIKVKKRKK